MLLSATHDLTTSKGIGITVQGRVDIQMKCRIESPVKLSQGVYQCGSIGAFTYTNGQCQMIRVKEIGRFCSIAPEVVIGDYPHASALLTHNNIAYGYVDQWNAPFHTIRLGDEAAKVRRGQAKSAYRKAEIVIGNDVWIGRRAQIMNGVSVGDGAIIAAGAIVTKDVAPYSIVGGNPAGVIRMRFAPNIIDRLLALQWWKYGADILRPVDFTDTETAAEQIEAAISEGFPVYQPVVFEIDPFTATIERSI